PCIELWFVLHFDDQAAHLERGDAQRRSKSLLSCEKVLTPAAMGQLVDRFGDASARAKSLDEKHAGDGSPPRSNPSTNMWELVNRIRQQSV
ncbi:MAG: RloB domain-containing protein, partial [Acidimicrobiia bacterium]|nr:RloB domain-containing protein [Acidimicrobiia bacterium]